MPRWSPGESRQRPCRAPVYRNFTGTHRGYTCIRPRQSYGHFPVTPRSSPVILRRSHGEFWWRAGKGLPMYCSYTGTLPAFIEAPHGQHRCSSSAGVCMGPGGAIIAVPVVAGAAPVVAGPSQLPPVHP
ncbi:hypothetical protein DPMN_114356 [Dreissena polymorpha]|uniref:Uncharacterized protein n=1 Tax=Dreissena polymorpha TaxID=45954 RepID=A0A9D4QRX6_DREPO|nr:hypothetical protein DPMN_114356 [Dreissena polymorpha]